MGLEAAVACRLSGFGVTVCEKGQSIGSAVKEWGHVRLFSANSINCSPHGLYATAGSNPNEYLLYLGCCVWCIYIWIVITRSGGRLRTADPVRGL